MSRWPHEPVAALGTVVTGSTPRTAERSFYGGDIPFVTPAELDQVEPIIAAARTLSDSGASEARLLPEGAVMVCCIGSLGKVGIAGRTVAANQQINSIVFEPEKIWPRFGFYACRLLKDKLIAMAPATTVAIVSKSKFERLGIPVPPLAEQRRIAEVLDRAEALRAKRRAALARLDSLIRAIFFELFDDREVARWSMSSVASVAHPSPGSIRTGPFGSQLLHSEFVDEGVPVLGIDNVVANEFRWGERRFISAAKYEVLKRYKVYPSDVLITIMGTCGRCAVVPDDIPVAINTKHLCCITLDQDKCLPAFLHSYFLLHPIARQYFSRAAKGAIMAGLNMGIIKAMPVPLVPIDLQREFERRIRAVGRLKDQHQASLAEMDALFASLQHRAFRGEL